MKTKYQYDKKTGYYYTYLPTDELYANGKPKYKKIRAKTIQKVDKKIREYEKQKMLHIEPNKVTVQMWYDEWFRAYKSDCREKTKIFYEYLYNSHIKDKLGNLLLSSVKEAQCRAILSSMAENYSIKTVKSVRSVLYSLFETAKANKLISYNPAEKMACRGKEVKNRRSLTEDERKKYLETVKTHPYGTYAAFLYFFGLRKGEALALTSDDIYEDYISINKQHVFVNNCRPKETLPKTKAGVRDIPIPNKAREYIDFEHLPKGKIFLNSKNECIGFSEHRNKWHSFIHTALGNDTDITEHYLRHNYCCMLFEANVDLMTVKECAGHDDINTTMSIYTHYTEQMKKQGKKKVFDIG